MKSESSEQPKEKQVFASKFKQMIQRQAAREDPEGGGEKFNQLLSRVQQLNRIIEKRNEKFKKNHHVVEEVKEETPQPFHNSLKSAIKSKLYGTAAVFKQQSKSQSKKVTKKKKPSYNAEGFADDDEMFDDDDADGSQKQDSGWFKCCRKKDKKQESTQEHLQEENGFYLEDTIESDYIDYPKLSLMSPDDREDRILELWGIAFQKAKGAVLIRDTFDSLNTKIKMFGRQMLVNNKEANMKQEVIQKSCPLIIMPDSSFKMFWNVVIIILLLYTATYMPYQICFISQASTGSMLIFEYTIDVLFFFDLFVSFTSAIETDHGTIEPRLKYIAKSYIKGWFFLDIFATFPTQLLESDSSGGGGGKGISGKYNKLVRLARLPRLYRLLRILRLFKLMKMLQNNSQINRFFDKLKMNAGVTRMIFTLVFALLSVHLISCFWFMAASFSDFGPETWVARMSMQDQDDPTMYLMCIYWALQTVATVGYGDFGAITEAELFLSVFWMIFGVGFYSFVIGNLTSIIANANANSENLYNKLKALEEFAKKTKLPEELHFKIKQFLDNNYSELFSRVDEDQLLKELPTTLREDVLQHRFGGLLDAIDFLRTCDNYDFKWAMVQMLKRIKVDKDDVIYLEGDFSEEIYFIKVGKVKLYAENGFPFASYKEGQQFGETNVIFKEVRDGKAVAQPDCLLFTLHKDNLEKLFEQFHDMKQRYFELASHKKAHHSQKKREAEIKNPIYNRAKANEQVNFLAHAKQRNFGFNQRAEEDDKKEIQAKLKEELATKELDGDTTKTKKDYDDPQSTQNKLDGDSKTLNTEDPDEVDSIELVKKKQDRLQKMLAKVDTESMFTKNVNNLLINSEREPQIRQPNNRMVEELKNDFTLKNKISTIDSYMKRENDPSLYEAALKQDILENDKDLGDADAEEGLENLAKFNEDMSLIALNVFQIYSLFDLVQQENDEITGWMEELEAQAIQVEENQQQVERKLEQLISMIN